MNLESTGLIKSCKLWVALCTYGILKATWKSRVRSAPWTLASLAQIFFFFFCTRCCCTRLGVCRKIPRRGGRDSP
jgi:hypothetical protein